MIHSDDDYPYRYQNLPKLKQLIDYLDWEVLLVYDACRWDLMDEYHTAEPVCAPGSNTPTWTRDVWCDDEFDWSDVTYVSGNGVVGAVANGNNDNPDITDHVGEYVEGYRDSDVNDRLVGGVRPDRLTDLALEYEPPLVVHYAQPHTPFIGEVSLRVDGVFDDGDYQDSFGEKTNPCAEYDLVEKGHISPEYARMAYRKNLELGLKESRRLQSEYERVLMTSDHGEELGPDNWDHGGPKSQQGRISPLVLEGGWGVDLPRPQVFGAGDGHEWVTL